MIYFDDFQKARFGNQLFFVAGTIGIALKNNTKYCFGSNMGHGGSDYSVIFENQIPISKRDINKEYHQNGFNYTDIVLTDDTKLIGYFQSEKFFKHCEDVIKNQFKFKQSVLNFVLDKYPNIINSASIHVRRGDYLTQQDYHPIIDIKYYNKFISEHVSDCENIYVFSDDIEWCKQTFKGDNYIFPEFNINNDLYSFVLLSQSKKIAISNSTYSWWAAWLNQNTNKQIYSFPHNKWFGKMYLNLKTDDILPSEWNIIEYE